MAIISINKRISKILENTNQMGYSTGIDKLDDAIHGYQNGKLITVAAVSGCGKTSFLTDGIIEVSKQVPVGVFSIEMGTKEVVDRAVYNIAGLNYHRCKKSITKKEAELVEAAKMELSLQHDIFVAGKDNKGNPEFIQVDCIYPDFILDKNKPQDSIEIVMDEMYEAGARAFFIDYIQLVRWGFKSESETLRLKELTNRLKAKALSYDVPIIILSQLTKEAANRVKKKDVDPTPTISDIRDGGYIVNDSDVILLLHRPDMIDKTNEELNLLVDAEEDAQIIIGKGRNGPNGMLKVVFRNYCMSWRSENRKGNDELF